MAERVAGLLQKQKLDFAARLIEGGEWMPFGFVDACERAEQRNQPEEQRILRQVQAIEIGVLTEVLLTP